MLKRFCQLLLYILVFSYQTSYYCEDIFQISKALASSVESVIPIGLESDDGKYEIFMYSVSFDKNGKYENQNPILSLDGLIIGTIVIDLSALQKDYNIKFRDYDKENGILTLESLSYIIKFKDTYDWWVYVFNDKAYFVSFYQDMVSEDVNHLPYMIESKKGDKKTEIFLLRNVPDLDYVKIEKIRKDKSTEKKIHPLIDNLFTFWQEEYQSKEDTGELTFVYLVNPNYFDDIRKERGFLIGKTVLINLKNGFFGIYSGNIGQEKNSTYSIIYDDKNKPHSLEIKFKIKYHDNLTSYTPFLFGVYENRLIFYPLNPHYKNFPYVYRLDEEKKLVKNVALLAH